MKMTSLALVAALTVTPALAQEPEPDPVFVKPGVRVRVTTPDGTTVRGRLLEADGQRLVVERGGKPQALPVDDVVALQVDHGRKGKPMILFTGLGLALGAALGAGGAEAEAEADCSYYDSRCRARNDASDADLRNAAIGGAVVGLATGLILSRVESSRRLQELPASRVRIGVAPLRKGVAARLAFSF
jgi:hypothetical protein